MFNLEQYAAECHVANPAAFAGECRRLREIVVETNRTLNLTRITEEDEFAIKHVADSLAIAREFPEIATEVLKIADIGCGAGFPSLVLALAFPQLRITAIDSTRKKILFVQQTAKEMGLKNLRAVHGRSNELNFRQEFRHVFDIVTARAVAPAPIIYLDACEFAKRKTGRFILYKTPVQAEEDLPALEIACARMPIQWQSTPVFELPGGAGERLFLYSIPALENSGKK